MRTRELQTTINPHKFVSVQLTIYTWVINMTERTTVMTKQLQSEANTDKWAQMTVYLLFSRASTSRVWNVQSIEYKTNSLTMDMKRCLD